MQITTGEKNNLHKGTDQAVVEADIMKGEKR